MPWHYCEIQTVIVDGPPAYVKYDVLLIKETVVQKREERGKIGTYLDANTAAQCAEAATQTMKLLGMIMK